MKGVLIAMLGLIPSLFPLGCYCEVNCDPNQEVKCYCDGIGPVAGHMTCNEDGDGYLEDECPCEEYQRKIKENRWP